MSDMKFKGGKYDSNLDVKDIAKLVRKDLKKAHPGFKFSVRIERYSGGRSLNVDLKEAPDSFDIHNPHRVKREKAEGYKYMAASNEPRYLLEAELLLKNVTEIVEAYNFDDSDSQTDYFRVNFYSHVEISNDIENADREKCLALADDEAERIFWDDQSKRDAIENERYERIKKENAEALAKAEAEEKAKGPIAVKKVVFEWSESGLVTDGQEFDSLDAANGLLYQIACERTRENPEHGHYTKTKLTVYWENEAEYTGRWDVNALDHRGVGLNGADCHIGMHITGYAKNVLKDESPLSARMSDESKSFFHDIAVGKYEV